MTSRKVCYLVSFLALAPVVLNAQIIRERFQVPLKSWAAPLYWQPSQKEAEALTGKPEAVVSTAADPPTTPLIFVGTTPCRVLDTRPNQGFSGAFGPPSLAANTSRTFPVQSSTTCSIPSTALAYSLNATVVPPGVVGYITIYPTGQPLPLAASLTDVVQQNILSNAVVVPAGTNGSIDVYALNSTDLVIDINGYYVPPTDAKLNTAIGEAALAQDTVGLANTAVGASALNSNTSGDSNTAIGVRALDLNESGTSNTANGYGALARNSTGSYNTAYGAFAMVANVSGSNNTAVGYAALASTGSNNVAIGYQAALNVSGSSNNNIHIANQGSASDDATIRIGTPGTQTSFYAAGVRGVTTGNNDAVPVVIDSNGQLGTASSSRRFKEDIQDMGDSSRDLLRLRPVTFRYLKPFSDGSKPIQYGLIAEEVAEVFPGLVAYSADGQIESVKYQVLDSLLLNEVQRQHLEIVSQNDRIRGLEQQIKDQQERMTRLETALVEMSDQPRVP